MRQDLSDIRLDELFDLGEAGGADPDDLIGVTETTLDPEKTEKESFTKSTMGVDNNRTWLQGMLFLPTMYRFVYFGLTMFLKQILQMPLVPSYPLNALLSQLFPRKVFNSFVD